MKMTLQQTKEGQLVDARGREWKLASPDGSAPVWPLCVICLKGIDTVTQSYYAHEVIRGEESEEDEATLAMQALLSCDSIRFEWGSPQALVAAIEKRQLGYLFDHRFLHASPRCVKLGTKEP